MVNEQDILDFKAAVKQVLLQKELNAIGLCQALKRITGDSSSSYWIMGAVLTPTEYCGRLGPMDEFTQERRQFLIFLDCLSVEDIADFMEHDHAD